MDYFNFFVKDDLKTEIEELYPGSKVDVDNRKRMIATVDLGDQNKFDNLMSKKGCSQLVECEKWQGVGTYRGKEYEEYRHYMCPNNISMQVFFKK